MPFRGDPPGVVPTDLRRGAMALFDGFRWSPEVTAADCLLFTAGWAGAASGLLVDDDLGLVVALSDADDVWVPRSVEVRDKWFPGLLSATEFVCLRATGLSNEELCFRDRAAGLSSDDDCSDIDGFSDPLTNSALGVDLAGLDI